MSESMNLARRPFINTRPVARVSLLLWVLGFLLLLGNISLYWNYLAGSGEKRADLDRLEAKIEQQKRENDQLGRRLQGFDLAQQNRQVRYLNQKIAERTFSWSRLFDELAKVMPDQVRVTSLSPSGITQEDDTRNLDDEEAPRPQARVQIMIHGESKSDEALFQFVDRLFAYPFADPDFPRMSREENDLVQFDLRVTYLPPDQPAQNVVIEEQEPLSPVLPTPGMPAPAQPAPSPGKSTEESEIDG